MALNSDPGSSPSSAYWLRGLGENYLISLGLCLLIWKMKIKRISKIWWNMANGPQWASPLVAPTHSEVSCFLCPPVLCPRSWGFCPNQNGPVWQELIYLLFHLPPLGLVLSFFPASLLAGFPALLFFSLQTISLLLSYFHTHTDTHTCCPLFSPFLLCFYHFEILKRLPLQFPRFHQKWSSAKHHFLILLSFTLESIGSLDLRSYRHFR